ncbi:hypothetical protein NUW54_g8033 [Trametes sanguinea]|uniref:Uncharacterized protein n=1 Tax=Trametes sanguinea TaxID=158606 RepID=A0ACC1PHE4_9APHY|nr:hypothetical protein NUW54_g8033 [Trametes sanguinea]
MASHVEPPTTDWWSSTCPSIDYDGAGVESHVDQRNHPLRLSKAVFAAGGGWDGPWQMLYLYSERPGPCKRGLPPKLLPVSGCTWTARVHVPSSLQAVNVTSAAYLVTDVLLLSLRTADLSAPIFDSIRLSVSSVWYPPEPAL